MQQVAAAGVVKDSADDALAGHVNQIHQEGEFREVDNSFSRCRVPLGRDAEEQEGKRHQRVIGEVLQMLIKIGQLRNPAKEEKGIACNVHYKPLPLLTAYKSMGLRIEDFPNAYAMFKNEISLPLYSAMTLDEHRYVTEHYADILKEYI